MNKEDMDIALKVKDIQDFHMKRLDDNVSGIDNILQRAELLSDEIYRETKEEIVGCKDGKWITKPLDIDVVKDNLGKIQECLNTSRALLTYHHEIAVKLRSGIQSDKEEKMNE